MKKAQSKDEKPTYLTPIVETIPQMLKGYHQWVLWKAEWKGSEGKWSKVPYDANTFKKAKSNDRSTWADFETACQTLATSNGQYDGIGFVFSDNDPFVGIDFDNCVDPEPEKDTVMQPFADYINSINSYTEYSPSGKGIHIIAMAKLPDGHSCRNGSQIEIYSKGRYLTFTGAALDGKSQLRDANEQVNQFYNQVFGESRKIGLESTPPKPPPINEYTFLSNPKIKKLWDGDISDYPSASEADLALCNLLTKYATNAIQIDNLFRKSALYRDKWDEKHTSNGQTYGQMTIKKALTEKSIPLQSSNRNLSQCIRDYIDVIEGVFSTRELYDELNIRDEREKNAARVSLKRLCDDGIIERQKRQAGLYRKIETELNRMDLINACTETVDLWLPLGIHHKVNFHPGNIVLVAGDANAGKTAFMLNIAKENMQDYQIHYFSSEMGPDEMRMRINLFEDFPLEHEHFNAYERHDDFAYAIKPGEGNLNIIDYLEVTEEFYIIGKHLKDIHHKLDGALAVVAVQKRHPSSDDPIGGKRGLEKPRLVLSMRSGTIKIIKAKNWATGNNPNGLQADFKLVKGCNFLRGSDWEIPEKDEN